MRSLGIPGGTIASLTVLALLAACSGGGQSGDTAQVNQAGDSVAAVAPATDTMASMAGMDHSAARDADQEFLRMMVDHHQGLIDMSHEAVEKGGAEVKAKARELDQKQDTEQEEMLGILKSAYNDPHQPTVTPEGRAMADSLSRKSGADYDMTYLMDVVEHHKKGIQTIDQFLPRFTRPDVRAMAERMKADQQKDIQEIQAKMNHGAA